ncbi:MAG: hypothetical protein ACK5N8_00645 [Alphaproteobacteria bacterium]
MFRFFSFIRKAKRVPPDKSIEFHEMKEFVHRKNNLKPCKITDIKNVILCNSREDDAFIVGIYAEKICEEEALMTEVNNRGHVCDAFFKSCKKMSKEEYQHDVLNYFLDKRTNLIYGLVQYRAKDVKFSIWERMVKDERFHRSIYHFFEKAKKDIEYWEKLVAFFHEKKFEIIPSPLALERYVLIEKELFQY